MADIVEAGPPAPQPRRGRAVALVGSGLVAGVVLAGLTTATAQTDPTPAPAATAEQEGRKQGRDGKPGKRGLDGVLHGVFTTRAPGGGYQQLAMQRGKVTTVSATSITVLSADNYSRTYAIDDGTLVKAGDAGTADIKAGDQVHVLAVTDGATATAVRVVDTTNVRRLRDRWRHSR